jgi:uncharacterized protein YdhG (YjbR/CyaY superfamily)
MPQSPVPSRAVDAYLDAVPAPARARLDELRATIRAALPARATEAIWYRIPTFLVDGTPIAAYAAFARHVSFFALSGSLLGQFAADLAGYATTKSAVRLPLHAKVPKALIRKLVRARWALHLARPHQPARN